MRGRNFTLTLQRNSYCLIISGWLHIDNLIIANCGWHFHRRSFTSMDLLDTECSNSPHLNSCTRHFPVSLRVVNIPSKESTAINKAWEEKPCSNLHLLDIHVPTIFSWWDGAQAIIRMRTIFSTNIGGESSPR